jgi:hypothetical protein
MQHHQINQVRVARARLRRQQPNDFGGDNVMAQVLIQVFHALLLKREFFRAVHPLSTSSMRAFASEKIASIRSEGCLARSFNCSFKCFCRYCPAWQLHMPKKSMLIRSQICPVSLVIQVFAPDSAIANLFDGRANPGRDNLVAIEPVPDLLRRNRLGDVVREIFRNALGQSRLAAAA